MLYDKISTDLFKSVFENSPVGLVLVNEDISLRGINNYMFATFKIDPKSLNEQMLGNALRCSNIYLTGKNCGEGDQCKDCRLQRVLKIVIEEGACVQETVLEQNFIIDGISQRKWFKVNASRIITNGEVFGVISFVDITVQIKSEKFLSKQLSLDAATGSINKAALVKELENLVTSGNGLTVAMIDMDDFKAVNDTNGHLIGDKVLNLFCSAAFNNIRKQDIIGRFGGEEFILIFPETDTQLVIKILQRISTAFQLACVNELSLSATFSAGIAEFLNELGTSVSVDAIITEADKNLYISKKAGKNRVTAYELSRIFE